MHTVLRVRFHGRGGQGMKTASRILGSAAFHHGFDVQDSPIYGAERRGAPMAAFTRISDGPILERGAIVRPHLVVVADDTLLDEPASNPLGGCDEKTMVVVNSPKPLEGHPGPTLCEDFGALSLETTGTLKSTSTVLGTAAASLVGLSEEDVVFGVEEELSGLSEAERQRNIELARGVHARAASWPSLGWPTLSREPRAPAEVIELSLDPPWRATPSIYRAGNAVERHTGSWRQFRPVLEPDKCNRCWLCFVWCPEAAIALDEKEYPQVLYDVCKGCLLCAHECPTHAFRIEREVRV